MAQHTKLIIGKIAEVELTAKRVVVRGTAVNQANVPGAANAMPLGVVQGQEGETFAAAGHMAVDVLTSGMAEIEVGTAGVTIDKRVYIADTAGTVTDVPATDAGGAKNYHSVGVAMATATDGAIVEVMLEFCDVWVPAS